MPLNSSSVDIQPFSLYAQSTLMVCVCGRNLRSSMAWTVSWTITGTRICTDSNVRGRLQLSSQDLVTQRQETLSSCLGILSLQFISCGLLVYVQGRAIHHWMGTVSSKSHPTFFSCFPSEGVAQGCLALTRNLNYRLQLLKLSSRATWNQAQDDCSPRVTGSQPFLKGSPFWACH